MDEFVEAIRHGRRLLAHAFENGIKSCTLDPRIHSRFSRMLGEDQIEALLSGANPSTAMPPEPATPGASRRLPGPPKAPAMPRLEGLLASIGGGPFALDIVCLTFGVYLDRPCRILLRNVGSDYLTPDVLSLCFGSSMLEMMSELAPGAPLVSNRFLEVSRPAGELAAHARIQLVPRLARWLSGSHSLDPDLGRIATFAKPRNTSALSPSALAVLEPLIVEVSDFLKAQRDGHGRFADIVLRGPQGSGRSEIAREVCRRLGLPVLHIPVDALGHSREAAEWALDALREALLLHAQVLITGGETLIGQDEGALRMRNAFATSSRPLIVTVNSRETLRMSPLREIVERDVRVPRMDAREVLWREVLPEVDPRPLSAMFNIGVGAIERVVDGARFRARGEPPKREDVFDAVRTYFRSDLDTLADKVEVTQTVDDLVVPDDIGKLLADFVSMVEYRPVVLGQWGAAEKVGNKSIGVSALFYGEPGTGKSMAAGILAKRLGLDMYRVDVSRIASKWLGETEKNLAKIFDAAEPGHVLLLLDEADSLIAKRSTEIRSSNDRYANMEVNYILQRFESFQGIAILTSNLDAAIDDAMLRRLTFKARFPFPDRDERVTLWQRLIPSRAPVADDIDFDKLAKRFELSGGYIRNIIMRGLYYAAREGAPLAMRHLLGAAEAEYREAGKLVAEGRLRS